MSYKEKVLGSSYQKEKIAAILLIGVLAIGVLFSASNVIALNLSDDFDMGSTAQCTADVGYFGYFDGNKVSVPVTQAPWEIGGIVVDSLGVDIDWTVTGEYMDWTTLDIDVVVKIYNVVVVDGMPSVTEITDNLAVSPSSNHLGTDALTGDLSLSFPLIDLLSGVEPMAFDGDNTAGDASTGADVWYIRVDVQILGTCTDDYDTPYSDATQVLQATYTIFDAATGFNIDGSITQPPSTN